MTIQIIAIPTTALDITKIQEWIKAMIQTHMHSDSRYNENQKHDSDTYDSYSDDSSGPECQNTLTSHPFSINTDMMRPVLYLIDPISDTIITVDLSTDPKYPTGSMPLHTVITPDGKKAFLSTMSSDTAPATILALDINNIDWQAGKADVDITNVIEIAEPNTIPPTPPVQNRTDDDTQPIIASSVVATECPNSWSFITSNL